jgi:hypothetical protein
MKVVECAGEESQSVQKKSIQTENGELRVFRGIVLPPSGPNRKLLDRATILMGVSGDSLREVGQPLLTLF